MKGLATNSIFLNFSKKSLICLEGKSTWPRYCKSESLYYFSQIFSDGEEDDELIDEDDYDDDEEDEDEDEDFDEGMATFFTIFDNIWQIKNTFYFFMGSPMWNS